MNERGFIQPEIRTEKNDLFMIRLYNHIEAINSAANPVSLFLILTVW